ncbi:BAG domain-containing protein Samui-like isoform X2 [Amphibalanus amphitrite]|uniref:BAG domain-containing protein Samui-like isoform X2 n=1 Tax=Amphibalanus amphitrite TaxID=1232801 RepID=UPI001C92B315|nr:BAG domain-containing protein Samui-like isoform X2 [Amphibalanus amphitrite]
MVDGPFGKGHSAQPKPNQVGKPPARKFSDADQKPPLSLGALIHQSADQRHHAAAEAAAEARAALAEARASSAPPETQQNQTVQSPTSYLPATTFVKPKSKMELQVEEAILQEHHEKDMIVDQPYRTTPLITPGAKVKRDTPIVASYLNMHPDPQVRGAAPHVSQVATNVRTAAQDRPDSGRVHTPKIIHHQFNTPANLYSQDNMASSIQQQTGIAPQVSGAPRKEFSIQNSETLKMILEEDQQKPATQHKPKSHVVYDVHEAKRGVWPPPEQAQKRELPPPSERPVRQTVPQPQRDLPDAPAVNQPPSMFTNSDKIAQSYSFNKLMWSVDPVERL